jgi:hypothetical protein
VPRLVLDPRTDVDPMGRGPIYSDDAERAVIGACFVDGQHAVPLVKGAPLYDECNQRILAAIVAVHEAGSCVDPITVADELTRRGQLDGVGGKAYLGELIEAVPIAENVAYHVGIVRECAQRRDLITSVRDLEGALQAGRIPAADLGRQFVQVIRDLLPATGPQPFLTDLELAALPAPEAVIAGMLYRDTLAAIVAKWESYKTFLALEMAFCLAAGVDYYGRPVTAGAVIYDTAEGGSGFARRVGALREKYGITRQVPLIIRPAAIRIDDPAEVAAMLGHAEAKLRDLGFAGVPVVAVFIDTLARNMSGDENKVEDMNAFIRGCDAIRGETGACVIAIHHTGHNEERGRGSSSLPAALDTEMFVTRDDDRVTVKCTKQKDAPHFADLTLEAYPLAGSLAFRAVVPTSPVLTPNERRLLTEVQDEPGLRSNAWMEASGLAKGSYDNARRRLLALTYVKRVGERYVATDAGRLTLGTKDNRGTTQVQEVSP